MAKATLTQNLLDSSLLTFEPRSVSALDVQVGGVDPLGLRQTNFDMMDRLLPGLNNVARHIRPFVVMCWARWKARTFVGTSENEEVLNDFVDRIEALYVWSQKLCEDSIALPGSSLVNEQVVDGEWTFGGSQWDNYRDRHKASTSLSAALNYGPGLRNLGWVRAVVGAKSLTTPNEVSMPAVMALDDALGDLRDHAVMSKLGSVAADAEFAANLGLRWSISNITSIEREVAAKLIGGAPQRLAIFELFALIEAQNDHIEPNTVSIRHNASDTHRHLNENQYVDVVKDWRALQTRQLFRLALEALFNWTIRQLDMGPASSVQLARRFVESVELKGDNAGDWFFAPQANSFENPVDGMGEIESAFLSNELAMLAVAIHTGLRFCFAEPNQSEGVIERPDRLPIESARQFVRSRATKTYADCYKDIIEHWVFAQHSYWCTGRGLADARTGGKTLLRLRVALDEGGWCLLPGPKTVTPAATPDRLETALSLMREWRGN